MDIGALVSSIQGELKVLPLNQLASGEELAANLVPVVPWYALLVSVASILAALNETNPTSCVGIGC